MNRKKLLLLFLISGLLLGCKDKTKTEKDSSLINSNEVQVEEQVENTPPLEEGTEVTEGQVEDNSQGEIDENLEEEVVEEVPEEEEEEIEELSFEENLDFLIDESDYISHIKMSQTGSTGKEITVIEDLKGSLKSIVIPEISGLEPNKDYLVFLVDSLDGDIVKTKEDSLILLENDNDETLTYVKDKTVKEVDEENK